IRDGTQPSDDDVGLPAGNIVDQQPIERLDLDARVFLEYDARNLDTLIRREQRRLFRIRGNGDNDAIEEPRATHDDVDVAVRQRIEGAGIHSEGGHKKLKGKSRKSEVGSQKVGSQKAE